MWPEDPKGLYDWWSGYYLIYVSLLLPLFWPKRGLCGKFVSEIELKCCSAECLEPKSMLSAPLHSMINKREAQFAAAGKWGSLLSVCVFILCGNDSLQYYHLTVSTLSSLKKDIFIILMLSKLNMNVNFVSNVF